MHSDQSNLSPADTHKHNTHAWQAVAKPKGKKAPPRIAEAVAVDGPKKSIKKKTAAKKKATKKK